MVMDRVEIKVGMRARVLDVTPNRFSKYFMLHRRIGGDLLRDQLNEREVLTIVSKPPRPQGSLGGALIRVRRSDGTEGEVYQTDLLDRCMALE